MYPLLLLTTFLSITLTSCAPYPPELFSPLLASKTLSTALKLRPPQYTYPQFTDSVNGIWKYFPADTWTSGFFPATLYAMNVRKQICGTGGGLNANWVTLGRGWDTGEIPSETQTNVGHDVGFLSFPFVDELTVNPNNQTAQKAVKAFATALAKRFNPIVGCTRSWSRGDPTHFMVIIDNMMNLEVLFHAEILTGNHTLRNIAISHADKTMKNHVRPDGSSFHVVEYNPNTGAVITRRTSQGFSDSSTWSRGQAWGLYGFANMHKRTSFPRYLDTARRMANYFISHIPSDGIVPWDFNAPTSPPRPADSSAATIAANGLLVLSQEEKRLGNLNEAKVWSDAAQKILTDITKLAWKPSWQSLLANGTVNNPMGNSRTGTVYGDYYFIKAGNKLLSAGLATCP